MNSWGKVESVQIRTDSTNIPLLGPAPVERGDNLSMADPDTAGRSAEDPRPPGLRERKRRATENAVESAAIRLALEHGPEHVTVADICEAAGISRSGFFNHFPTKESAIFGRPVDLKPAEWIDELLDEHHTEPAIGVFHIALRALHTSRVNTNVARARAELLARHPDLAFHLAAVVAKLEQQLIALVAAWLARHPAALRLPRPDPVAEATLIVGTAMTVGNRLMADWLSEDNGDVEVAESAFRAALAELRSVIAPPDGP